ncbi:MAG: hypothetical protein QOC70_2907 [Verrucomicrobiota bacterium]|jgi:hypothetical protein
MQLSFLGAGLPNESISHEVHKGHHGDRLLLFLVERWTLGVGRWTFPSVFPLFTATFPSSASDLERLLNESLQRVFVAEPDPVTLRERSYPHLEAITLSLDGARLRADPPRPPVISGKTSPALEVDQLTLSASPLLLGPAAVNLSLSAREVQFSQGKDSNAQIVLSPESAADGSIEISATQIDLEALIAELAQNQAGKQGITIDGVQLKLRQKNAHSLAVEVRLRARKLFLSASLQVTGQLELDDQLNFTISDLNCTGDGGIATLACGILKPYLQKIDGREFPLMSLPLGNICLRDVRLAVGDRVSVTAEFGSAT